MADISPPGDLSSSPTTEQSSEHLALQNPTKTVGAGFLTVFCLANIVSWAALLPIQQIILPIQVAAIDAPNKITNLAIVSTLGAILAIIASPLAGVLSDRTTSSWGRRRPWLLIYTALAAVVLGFLANANSIPQLILEWALLSLFMYSLQTVIAVVIPDQVPMAQRATVSGFAGFAQPVGILLGAILIGQILKVVQTSYYVIIALFVVFMLLFALTLRDRPLPKIAVPSIDLRALLSSFWVNPVKYPDFGWAWLTRFFAVVGYSASISFLLYYLQDVVHYEKIFPGQQAAQGVSLFQLVSTVMIIIFSIVCGVLSDRLQRRKIFVAVSGIGVAIALLIIGFFPIWPVILATAALVGASFGSYLAVDTALVTQVLPSAVSRGKDLGVLALALSIPQVLAPLMAAIILNTFHSYTVLFVVAAVLTAAGGLLVQPIKSVR